METRIIKLPNDETKLFDEEENVGTSSIPDLSLPSEDDEEEVISNNVWDYTINDLFKLSSQHAEGKSCRKWIKHQEMENIEQFYQWHEINITIGEAQTSFLENPWDKSSVEFLV